MALSGLYSSYYSDEDTGKPRDYTAAYGGIPNLPKYTTDTTRVLGPDVKAQLIANLPGYQNMLNQDVSNIQSYQRGQVPADVLSLLQQQAAERGVGTGIPGSQNVDAAYLRALGLTSLQLQQMGHSMLGEQIAWTPIQQSQLTTQTRDLGAERAVYAAAPNPYAAAQQAMRDALAGIGAGSHPKGTGGYTIVGGGGGGYSPSTYGGSSIGDQQAALDAALRPWNARANAAAAAEEERARQWRASQAGYQYYPSTVMDNYYDKDEGWAANEFDW